MMKTTFKMLIFTAGCQHFVAVDLAGPKPVFTWPGGAPVASLTVLADEDCPAIKNKAYADRVWWQISGPLKSGVIYGQVPSGATELAPARALTYECRPYVVTVTDANFRGESVTFRP